MFQMSDVIKSVQAMHDDAEGTYITDDYVMRHAQRQYTKLYNKLRLTGFQFAESSVVLPSVPAGTRDLSTYQASGQPLAMLLQPRILEYKLPGQDDTYWRRADGPLDSVRDMPANLTSVDSWTWRRFGIELSLFSAALDLRITGDFLFDPLTGPDSSIELAQNFDDLFALLLAVACAKARGNANWVMQYQAEADDAFDDLKIAVVRANQSRTERVGRISRRRVTQPSSVR